MDLQSPRPLGEKKLSDDGVTSKFLEIAEEKEKKKFKIPAVSIPTLNELKLIKPRKHGEKKEDIKTTPLVQSSTPKNVNLEEKHFKEPLNNRISLYLKTHKEIIINISLVVVPLLILSILVITIISYTNSEPYRISREFLERIEKKDFRRAYELTTDAYKTIHKEEDFEKAVAKLNSVDISNPKVKKKSLDDDKEMGQYAYIKYRVSGYYVDITMFNDSSDWGVHSIEIALINQ